MDDFTTIAVGAFFGNGLFVVFLWGCRRWMSDEARGVERISTMALVAIPMVLLMAYLVVAG
ncbi:hypothetical protein [Phaeobacter gallaeciensis]|uniref:Uncharacterized protein n=1 Tax=Phaeobacter gallaeciensis TaxID=60890 RepID=A0AAC9Z9N9_9RHOB|nr:hypothetical protein [Phaeobacter gallaeciensis]AHD09999.1 hypothetical protein Gal_02252 [Phaeobacter gallaeciensis DSM 26640]ATE93263.1 hypothetical protein PhaeoP11_02243 [Phaeobacter gallaeciensis]ATE96916.1 hypothetical protein PhaeoP73_01604 [Phaeobacter gallaeciensis]ATF01927.1 hypothetical protein PhaeoP75_02292 [Phaeobacter gallaeciensis]ATF06307.1 hypothetical protein PhaeoP63_02241 [Phaeobacter gallaeciensis]